MITIESTHNDFYKNYTSLTTSKGLKKTGLFLLSGEKLILDFLKNPNLTIYQELITENMMPLTSNAHTEFPPLAFSQNLFDDIDVLGTHYNILVLRQPILDTIQSEQLKTYNPNGLEVVLPLGDPSNLGALIRSCEAFAVSTVHLTTEAAHPFLPKSIKASAGSCLRIKLLKSPSLREYPPRCIALDVQGAPLYNFQWPTNCFLVVGEEGQGFGDNSLARLNKFEQYITIPTKGVESLNVVVATSIALAHRAKAL